HLVRRQVNRRSALVRHEKTMTVGMPLDASRERRDAPRDQQRAGAVLHDVAGALERCEACVECAALARAQVEALRELARRERLARALQLAQDFAPVIGAARVVALGARTAA